MRRRPAAAVRAQGRAGLGRSPELTGGTDPARHGPSVVEMLTGLQTRSGGRNTMDIMRMQVSTRGRGRRPAVAVCSCLLAAAPLPASSQTRDLLSLSIEE